MHCRASLVAALALFAGSSAPAQSPISTSFTYQGVLKSGGAPYSGSADLRFTLFDSFSAGNAIGLPLEVPNVAVAAGVFTAELFFNSPNAFNGEARWLAIEVRAPSGGGAYVPLAPRQEVTAAPYALYAVNANTPFTYSAGNAVFTGGNVGIGTATPGVKLEVAGGRALIGDGPADEDAKLTIGSDFSDDFTFGGTALSVGDASAASINVGTSVNNWLSLSTANLLGYPLIQSNGPGGMALRTNGANRVRITGTGDVGIGTDTPTAKLHVRGDVSLNGDGFGLTLRGFTDNLTGRINRLDLPGGGLTIADHATGPIVLATSTTMGAAGERMRIAPNGNVGIGTTSPQARLHVAGDVALNGDGFGLMLRGFSDNLVGRISRVDVPGGGMTIADHATGPIILATSTIMGAAGERMRVTADGNVGIGTTNPTARLDVAGGLAIDGDFGYLSLKGIGGTESARVQRLDLAGAGLMLSDFKTGPIQFATSTSMGAAGERMRLTPEGNLAIGTTTPATGLHLEGPGFPKSFITMRSSGGNGDAGLRFDRDASTFWHIFNSAPAGDALNIRNNAFGVVLAATQAGNVGIGTDVPGSFRLAVNGSAANSTGSWSIFSDARLKMNIRDLPEGTLDKLLGLRGRNFEYTREARRNNLGEEGVQTGFIAQEVQTVFPEWVAENRDGYLFITERGTTALMVEALRELRAEKDEQIKQLANQAKGMSEAIATQTGLIIDLREDVTTLRNEGKELRARIAALEKIVEAMLPESPMPGDAPASHNH